MSAKRVLFLFLLLVFFNKIIATSYYFFVGFNDKANTPYTLSNPLEYLSQRAIDRRAYFNVSIDSLDIPVNEAYIQQVRNLGAVIHCKSKWMNGITITLADSSIRTQIQRLGCVRLIQYTGENNTPLWKSAYQNNDLGTTDYGIAQKQIEQVHGDYLHHLGYKGRNIHIGVLDAGYLNVDINQTFDSLRTGNQLLGTKDFVNSASDIYHEHPHGANVLSIMGGNITARYLGSAPEASFLLIRTENASTEYLMEADFWVSGIEYADSAGVDIINSSLGYTEFDDPTMNFTYADMNGMVSRASRAATIASQKGIVVVNSAGNDGHKRWKYIGVPADAKEIVTVGSVDSLDVASPFSSFGPSSDGRVKPEICGLGTASGYVNTSGDFVRGNGTSYSAPVIAGLMACYLQYFRANIPNFTIENFQQSIFESANLYLSPTDQMGYGIPNFEQAVAEILKIRESDSFSDVILSMDSRHQMLRIDFSCDLSLEKRIKLYNLSGICLFSKKTSKNQLLVSAGNLKGIYFVYIASEGGRWVQKVVI